VKKYERESRKNRRGGEGIRGVKKRRLPFRFHSEMERSVYVFVGKVHLCSLF
jgi:hypothetical protein